MIMMMLARITMMALDIVSTVDLSGRKCNTFVADSLGAVRRNLVWQSHVFFVHCFRC